MKFGGLFSFFSTGTRHVAVTWELESIISEIYRGNVTTCLWIYRRTVCKLDQYRIHTHSDTDDQRLSLLTYGSWPGLPWALLSANSVA